MTLPLCVGVARVSGAIQAAFDDGTDNMPDKPTPRNPLAAAHAVRATDPKPEDDAPDDDAVDPIQLAVVQGLAANPATASMTPDQFAERADQLIASLGIPASMLESGQRESSTAQDILVMRNHARALIAALTGHPLHSDGQCEVCNARDWLESI